MGAFSAFPFSYPFPVFLLLGLSVPWRVAMALFPLARALELGTCMLRCKQWCRHGALYSEPPLLECNKHALEELRGKRKLVPLVKQEGLPEIAHDRIYRSCKLPDPQHAFNGVIPQTC